MAFVPKVLSVSDIVDYDQSNLFEAMEMEEEMWQEIAVPKILVPEYCDHKWVKMAQWTRMMFRGFSSSSQEVLPYSRSKLYFQSN